MRVVELPAQSQSHVSDRPGYRAVGKECLFCKRPFRIYVQMASFQEGGMGDLTVNVSCPSCHRSTAEVLVPPPHRDVFVEAIE